MSNLTAADKWVVELRSDTFTKPSKRMLEAICAACPDEIGDSQYDEDPSIIKLEKKVADLFGKEAALFMPSGTMANLVGIMVHCYERGSQVIIGEESHLNLWEQGSLGTIGNIYVKQLENLKDGSFDLAKLEAIMSESSDRGRPNTRCICLENTHNWKGGRILPMDFVAKVKDMCVKYGVKLHMDGSRIMNAALALNVDVKLLTQHLDSVNFCLSKGVGAPVGSILVGSNEFILKAIRVRQSLGGGMRQAGVLAAAALFGMSEMEVNLRMDNDNAKRFANGIASASHGLLSTDVSIVDTNIVLVTLINDNVSFDEWKNRLATVTEEEVKTLGKSISVRVGALNERTARVVTHLDVSTEGIDMALLKMDYVSRHFAKQTFEK